MCYDRCMDELRLLDVTLFEECKAKHKAYTEEVARKATIRAL